MNEINTSHTTTKRVKVLSSTAELTAETRYALSGRNIALIKVADGESHVAATMEAISVDASVECSGEDDVALQQLLVEARLLLSLKEHPHIAQIQGVVSADRVVSIVRIFRPE
jgi:hypothetical protein